MKPVEQDEMFPESASFWEAEEVVAGSSSSQIDGSGNERHVHADFNNDFGDLFDDDDLE